MARVDKLEEARKALRSYWGATGPDRDGNAMRQSLRTLKLSPSDCETLLDELPVRSVGTTGDRIGECYRVLERIGSAGAG